jgi:hypothetical protein
MKKQDNKSYADIELFKLEQARCLELMVGRNKKYGDSWKKLRLNSVVDLINMKIDRCVKQDLDEDAIKIELEDIANYCIFGLMMVRHKKEIQTND